MQIVGAGIDTPFDGLKFYKANGGVEWGACVAGVREGGHAPPFSIVVRTMSQTGYRSTHLVSHAAAGSTDVTDGVP